MAGTENQCLGVAEALRISPQVLRVGLNAPWSWLSPYLGFEARHSFSPPLPAMPPFPDIVLASGRKSVAAGRFIKAQAARQAGVKTSLVQIQDPRVFPWQRKVFDLIAVPAHDPVRGENVLVTTAAPNRITPERLADACRAFPDFEGVKRPRVGVLIGGTSKAYRMSEEVTKTLAGQLASLDAGLMVTASRRTGDNNRRILGDALAAHPDCYVWDGHGENPYFAILGWADILLVTADSVSMLSEAASTGKPVYMIPMDGGARRIDALHENLIAHGAVRRFDGTLETWAYEPLCDAVKIADAIKALRPDLFGAGN